MSENPLKKLKTRTTVLLAIIIILGFGLIMSRLAYLTLIQGEELQEKAVDQQLQDTSVSAKRGSIYDRNGKTLATSASVWRVVLAPAYFENDEQRHFVSEGLARILGMSEEDVFEEAKQTNSYYRTIKRQIESEERDKILEFVDEISSKYNQLASVIVLEEDYKRYYPYSDFAAAVIGFTGSDDQGLSGLEYMYDEYLTGVPGRIVTENNATGTTMPFEYQQKEDAVDGNSLTLTLDETVQHFLEKYLQQGIEEYKVVEGAVAICMDVNTGAILGMACEDSFDLNDPYTLANPEAQAEVDKLSGDKKTERKNELLSKQWRNKAISDTYYPGSVFKVLTASMALQENVVNDNSSFYCPGYYVPYEGVSPIGCHNRDGHGSQDFTKALCNSCNPAFMMMGKSIGPEKFWEYYQSFGLNSTTGIDLPGEAKGLFFGNGSGEMGPTDLAIGSFGQGLTVTPIGLLTAVSAVANGGDLVQPYLVSQITDADGNVVKTTEPVVKRNVIASDVSQKMSDILETNAIEGTGKNGYVAGYRIAGKTGTSEKIGQSRTEGVEDYIASYCGFAPADNPQIAVIVYFDTPTGDTYYGGQVAAPIFAGIMSEICPYLGIDTQYTEEELEYVDTLAGTYLTMNTEDAQAQVKADGFEVYVYGEGDTVCAQVPQAGSKIPRGGRVVLYTTNDSTSETVTVPDMVGYTVAQVNEIAAECNLNISFSGSVNQDSVYSYSQSIDPRTEVKPGTVVTVYFGNEDEVE
ncbi:MAG: PASTA domain-containing protein [Lachnospiraceae bacterium]|nr:PASTA domain-containing protein [Lachnospiraceae bacterium]